MILSTSWASSSITDEVVMAFVVAVVFSEACGRGDGSATFFIGY